MLPAEGSTASALPSVALTRRGAARWRGGHPWIFRDDIEPVDLPNGEIVRALAAGGDPLGTAFYGSVSKIALRRLGGPEREPGPDFLAARLDAAIAWRETIAAGTGALRLVSSDADGIPGLIVERYGEHLVVQALVAGVDRRLEAVAAHLDARLRPRSILARNDVNARALEGLPLEVRDLRGQAPARVEVEDGELRMVVDLREGQKTGGYLDQRENRAAAAEYLRGRVLDAFCYDGGFALHAARRAETVLAVDASAPALERGAEAASRSGVSNVVFERANVFDFLQSADKARRRFDGIVLDPPAFVKSRKDLAAGVRAYKEINLRAMRCLEAGGVLVTCSCSYNLREDGFMEVLAGAAADARRRVVVVEKRSQARDHPVLLGLPESHYLKCLILKVD